MCRSDDSGDLEEGEATVPADMADSWRTAEAQLFGALLEVPELYRGVLAMVGDTVDLLRRLGPSTGALLNAAPTIAALVRNGLEDGSAGSIRTWRVAPLSRCVIGKSSPNKPRRAGSGCWRRRERGTGSGSYWKNPGTGRATPSCPIGGWRHTPPPGTHCS